MLHFQCCSPCGMKKSENIDKPEELDFTSRHFNALRALYEPDENIIIPKPNAPIYDNLSCFIETKDGIFPKERKQPAISKRNVPSTSHHEEEVTKPESEETTNTSATTSTKRKVKNVLTRMDNTVKGPLTFLKKCMDEKLRIKVYIRSAVTIRGFCIGFLEAFDKHWNLVLKDVFEQWTRKRKRPVHATSDKADEKDSSSANINIDASASTSLEDKSNILSQRGRDQKQQRHFETLHKGVQDDRKTEIDVFRKPKIVVRKKLKRKEICERHVDQMLIRGEQIVFVTLDSS